MVHRPAVTNDEDCVCLIAVEGRLKFKGILGRFIPFFVDM
jgi:anti-sigma factor ChrR (cupin superfamily)